LLAKLAIDTCRRGVRKTAEGLEEDSQLRRHHGIVFQFLARTPLGLSKKDIVLVRMARMDAYQCSVRHYVN